MPRSRILTHERFTRPAVPDMAQRQLAAIREIVHAYLNADRPEEVFQFALDRVSPLIGATLASVYVVDGVSELMRLVAAYNWPAKHKKWLGEVRIRLGFGPSGEAAAERRVIEVPDVNSDQGVEDWAEVASELGYRSLVALPLQDATGALGAVTFFFAEPGTPSPERRDLMRLVADQMAATAEKARFTDEHRRMKAALSDVNAELERQSALAFATRRAGDEFVSAAAADLREPVSRVVVALRAIEAGSPPLESLLGARAGAAELEWQLDEMHDLAALRLGHGAPELEQLGAEVPVEGALRMLGEGRAQRVSCLTSQEPLPTVRLDRRKAPRMLASLLAAAIRKVGGAELRVTRDNDHLSYRVQGTGAMPLHGNGADGGGVGVTLAGQLAQVQGGALHVVAPPGGGVTFIVSFPAGAEPGDG